MAIDIHLNHLWFTPWDSIWILFILTQLLNFVYFLGTPLEMLGRLYTPLVLNIFPILVAPLLKYSGNLLYPLTFWHSFGNTMKALCFLVLDLFCGTIFLFPLFKTTIIHYPCFPWSLFSSNLCLNTFFSCLHEPNPSSLAES